MQRKALVFAVGVMAGIVGVVGGSLLYARLGLINPRADIPVSSVESSVAMKFLDASLDRRAPDEKNPVGASEAELTAGMKLFQSNCAGCHGDINQEESPMAESFYPRAPQFIHDAPDMPGNQNFYLIKHGIRYSGMPAWGRAMTDQQIWQVVGFLSAMDKLPESVQGEWRALSKHAGGGSK